MGIERELEAPSRFLSPQPDHVPKNGNLNELLPETGIQFVHRRKKKEMSSEEDNPRPGSLSEPLIPDHHAAMKAFWGEVPFPKIQAAPSYLKEDSDSNSSGDEERYKKSRAGEVNESSLQGTGLEVYRRRQKPQRIFSPWHPPSQEEIDGVVAK